MDATKRVAPMSLYPLPTLYKAVVLHRPSKTIKSPYVADVLLEDGEEALCHSPGLGCGGMVAAGQTIYMSTSSEKAKTQYTAQLSLTKNVEETQYVGIHPMTNQAIATLLLPRLHPTATWKKEVPINEHTRLDAVGTADNKTIYVEIKNVMIASNAVVNAVINAAVNAEINAENAANGTNGIRIALFPDGYRKSLKDTISPRAVKHAETLGTLVGPNAEAYLLFIVSRSDCHALQLNPTDPAYCEAVAEAMKKGMQVRVFCLDFQPNGTVTFHGELPLLPIQ